MDIAFTDLFGVSEIGTLYLGVLFFAQVGTDWYQTYHLVLP